MSEPSLEPGASDRRAIDGAARAELLARVFEFVWRSHDSDGPDNEHRLEALRQRLMGPSDEIRQFTRTETAGLAELSTGAGRLLDISAGGLGVSTARPLVQGAQTRVLLTDDENGWRYQFPCVVVWAHDEPDVRAGLRFAGKPQRVRLG